MIKTEFVDDFLKYYYRAEILQNTKEKCGDNLQDNVTIYNCIYRKYAGFSNVLEDLTYGKDSPAQKRYKKIKHNLREWLYIYLFHRMTGSGASFHPDDHGYRNSIAHKVASKKTIKDMVEYVKRYDGVMFTSIGNQVPPFPKPAGTFYRTGGKLYLCEYAPKLINDLMMYLSIGQKGIKEAVDFCCRWHKRHGLKQYHFCLTAFIMDIAEYWPDLVDQDSHCYYGSNAIKALNVMYINDEKIPKKTWYEKCMQDLVNTTGNKPYSLEDVLCDAVRYWSDYIPKGYDHLTKEQVKRLSKLTIGD